MPRFGEKSLREIRTIDSRLNRILYKAIEKIDFSVIEGHRSLDRQKELFEKGFSKVSVGKHNKYPSMAVDIRPYPYNESEKDLKQFYVLIGYMKAIADLMDIKIRSGSDWNRDNDIRNDPFQDCYHFEIDE